MQLAPYVFFDGCCKAAFEYYARHVGGTILQMQSYGESPVAATVPAAWHPRILQARLQIGKLQLCGSDSPAGQYEKPQGYAVGLTFERAADVDPVFAALAQDGKITLSLRKTFWSPRFGMLTDAFQIPWILSAEEAV